MDEYTQAKIQIKKLTWLVLGLCFVMLYSCPVKKYLLLTFAGAKATESTTCQFQKDFNSHCEKIVYLRRQSAVKTIVIAAKVQVLLPIFSFSFTSTADWSDCRAAISRARLARYSAITGAPPRYLGLLRFRV